MKNRPALQIFLLSLLTIIVTYIMIFTFAIPRYRQNIIESRRKMTRELVTTVSYLIQSHYDSFVNGQMTEQEAKENVLNLVRSLRYGNTNKEYFWINDLNSVMLMHPYRTDMEGENLETFRDSRGDNVFLEFISVATKSGEGFVEYTWQLHEDTSRIIPKLSYVRLFKPWSWIIGSGVYYEDLEYEINGIIRGIRYIFIIYMLLICTSSILIIIHNRRNERDFKKADQKSKLYDQKYREIFESSNDAIFIHDADSGAIIESNDKSCQMYGYTREEFYKLQVKDISEDDHFFNQENALKKIMLSMELGPQLFEWKAKRKDGTSFWVEVNLRASFILGKKRILALVRDIEKRKLSETIEHRNFTFREIITNLSKEFISTPLAAIPAVIYKSLRSVGEFTSADRSCIIIFENTLDNTEKIIHEWRSNKFSARSLFLNKEKEDFISSFIKRGENLVIGSINQENLSPELIDFVKENQLEAIEIVPLNYQDNIIGGLVLESHLTNPAWSTLDTDLLYIVGEIIVNSLIRKRNEESIRERERQIKLRLDNLISSQEEHEDFSLFELIREEEIQKIQDVFAEANNVVSFIISAEGELLTKPSGESNYCREIITNENDRIALSEFHLNLGKSTLKQGKTYFQLCPFVGLYSAVAPVEVGGKHIANWIVSQRNQESGIDSVREKALQLRLEEDRLTEDFLKIPVFEQEKAIKIISILSVMAEEISIHTYNNLQQARVLSRLQKAEIDLQESKNRYKAIYENASDAIFILKDMMIIDCNNSALRFFGGSRNELTGKIFADISAEQDSQLSNDDLLEHYIKSAYEGIPQMFEWKLRRKNGILLDVEISLSSIKIYSENIILLLCRDITAKKRNQSEIISARNFYSMILDSLNSIIITTDIYGNIDNWNRAAKLSKYGINKELHGLTAWEAFPFLQDYQKIVYESLKANNQFHIGRIREGKEQPTYYSVYFYPFSTRERSGMIIRIDDITENESRDQQLLQAQKMESLGSIAGGLAHDFNNVLSGITGTVSLLEFNLSRGEVSDKDIKEGIETIKTMGNRATEMVTQILAFSRNEEPVKGKIDLNSCIKNVLKICENSLNKSIDLQFEYLQNPAVVLGDITQIEQLLLNICINASHAMTIMKDPSEKQGGVLEVSLRLIVADDIMRNIYSLKNNLPYYLITIRDTGVGIPEEHLEKIFDPFFTTKDKTAGTGLGLSMAYRIIKHHEGVIDVKSLPGVGSTFYLYLPASVEDTDFEKQVENISLQTGEGTILVADDEPTIRLVASKILKKCGYDVVLAIDGQECVEIYKTSVNSFVLILLDITMPRLSGKEAFRIIRNLNPGQKVLLASGFRYEQSINSLLEEGLTNFIQKPYTLQTLCEAVAILLKENNNC